MRYPSVVALLLFVRACSNADHDEAREVCEAAYARLDALGCEAMMKELIERGCFDSQFEELDCDLSVLDPCTNEIAAFDEPLDSFLDRKCGPAGTKTIEWPQYDAAAIAAAKAAKAAKAEAEAAELAKQEAIEARERAKLEELASRAAKAAKVEIGTIEIRGALSKTSVRKVVENELDTVRTCYGAALVHAPTTSGEVKLNFVIAGNGKVAASVVQESTLRGSNVAVCMARAIKRLQFPKPSSGGNVLVTVPYTLSPGEWASE